MSIVKGTTDLGGRSTRRRNYGQGNMCPVCGRSITNEARYCQPHKALLQTAEIQGQIARLLELAREREACE